MSMKALLKKLSSQQVLIPVLMDFVHKEQAKMLKDPEHRYKVVRKDSVLSIQALKRRMIEFNHGSEEPVNKFGLRWIHPSGLDRCPRELWFKLNKAPCSDMGRQFSLSSYFIFETGTSFHVMMQNLFARAGILVQREVPVEDHALGILGHCDAWIRINGLDYLVELKSINGRGFSMLMNAPKEAHRLQSLLYMKALEVPRCIVLYYDKDRSNVKEYLELYSDERWNTVVKPKMKDLREAAVSPKLPERNVEYTATTMPCSFCAYVSLCYVPEKLKEVQRSVSLNAVRKALPL